MSTNRKNRAALLFIALVSGLAMTACGTSKKSEGGLTPNITIPSISASASAPASGSALPTSEPGNTSTSQPKPVKGATNPPSNTPLKVSVGVDPVADVTTSSCPHTFTVHGKISVNKGPITLTYGWKNSEAPPTDTQTVHFGGTGPQFVEVATQVTATSVDTGYGEQLVVVGQPVVQAPIDYAKFMLTCGASVSTPSAAKTHGTCPFTTTFTTDISVPIGPQDVAWTWSTTNGASGVGSHDFTGTGADSYQFDLPISVSGGGGGGISAVNSFGYTVRITSAGGAAKTGHASCDLENQ